MLAYGIGKIIQLSYFIATLPVRAAQLLQRYYLTSRFHKSGFQGVLAIFSLLVLTANTGIWGYNLWQTTDEEILTNLGSKNINAAAHSQTLERTLIITHDATNEAIQEKTDYKPDQNSKQTLNTREQEDKSKNLRNAAVQSNSLPPSSPIAVQTLSDGAAQLNSDNNKEKRVNSLIAKVKKLVLGDKVDNYSLKSPVIQDGEDKKTTDKFAAGTWSATKSTDSPHQSPNNAALASAANKLTLHNSTYYYIINDGDTFVSILSMMNIDKIASHLIAKSIDRVYKLSQLRPGYKIALQIALITQENKRNSHGAGTVHSLSPIKKLRISINNVKVNVYFDPKKRTYLAELEENSPSLLNKKADKLLMARADAASKSHHNANKNLAAKPTLASREQFIYGSIDGSFARSAAKKGAPSYIIAHSQKLFHNINITKGNFKLIYDTKEKKENALIYAAVENTQGQTLLKVYRHKIGNRIRYTNQNGLSVAIANAVASSGLKLPLRNAVVGSEYGMRFHPKLKRHKIHKGIDYKAQRGSLILASGDGVIRNMGYNRGYGRFIKIQHHDRIHSTLYAHMEKFAPHIRLGQEVRQGETIGFVGSTGLSTGAHLHFEVHKNGIQINPRSALDINKNPPSNAKQTPLPAGHMKSFMAEKQRIDRLVDQNITLYTANRS